MVERATGGSGAADRLLEVVRELVHELHPRVRELRLDSAFDRDLGLDSLAMVELLARVESAFGVELPDEALGEAETPRDLLRHLDAGPSEAPRPATRDGAEGPRMVAAGHAPPDEARTWPEVLSWHAERSGEVVQLRLLDSGSSVDEISYGELLHRARRVAARLDDLGAEPGDRIALMLPTGRGYFLSFFGVLLAGCVPVPIYPPWRRAQLEDHLLRQAGILDNAGARLLVTVPEARLLAGQLRLRVPSLRHVVTVERLTGDEEQAAPTPPGGSGSDIAFIQYTSGSTGRPKGVVLTHSNLLTNVRAMGAALEVTAEDVFVSWLPLYHDMGLIGAWLGSLYYGIPLVVMPPTSFLRRPARWLQAIHTYGGTLSASPNFGYELCLNRITDEEAAGLDLSSWRLAFNGAEPVSPQTIERFTERFAPLGFRSEAMAPVYGLAESSLGVTLPPPGRPPRIDAIAREPFLRSGEARPAGEDEAGALRFVGCGSPLAGHEVRIVDEAGTELPERRQGRIQFRGPSATGGYFRNPEATQDLMRDGWLDSGDLGYLADGELFVTGRSKDLIIRMGRNIHPQELEQAVGEIAGVRKGRTAVFGASDPQTGIEQLVVLAETREREGGKREEMRRRIVSTAVDLLGTPPDDVVLASPGTVLKTSSGKIRREACRERYEKGALEAPSLPVWRQFARLAGSAAALRLRRLPGLTASILYAAYAWAIFAIAAAIAWGLMAVLPGIDLRWRVLRAMARLMLRVTAMRPRVEGELESGWGPTVVVANHASMLDGLVLVAILPERLAFVAAGEFSSNWITGPFLRRLGAVFVERQDRTRAAQSSEALKEQVRGGIPVVFFPEGRMSRTPGLQPFRLGAFTVAAEAGARVVPITIAGTEKILRGDSKVARRGRIQVFISDPIDAPGKDWEAALQLRRQARTAILEHFEEPDLEG